MNISIVKIIMRLFAILTSTCKINEKYATQITQLYLQQLLQLQSVNQYLNIFTFHNQKINNSIKNSNQKEVKIISKYAVKILLICEQLINEIDSSNRLLLIVYLLEMIKTSDTSNQSRDIVDTIAQYLFINKKEYNPFKTFILKKVNFWDLNQNRLVITDTHLNEAKFNTIHLPNLRGDLYCHFVKSQDVILVKYFGDDNLYYEGKKVQANIVFLFHKGKSISGAKVKPIYYEDVARKFHLHLGSSIELTVKDVEYTYPGSQNGIKRLNLQAQAGELIGVMGGSGTGKSTLLSILNGSLKPHAGEISINGIKLYEKGQILKQGVIGYIPQDDLLFEELTVFQNLYFNAKLCFGGYSEKEINEAVNSILKDLELHEIRHLKVGNPLNKFISGGQRKRLNIALELIRKPFLLFVDEPTSGLSSADSDRVMNLLKNQALQNKLIITNIHQPSNEVFKLFDKLLILDKGGYPVYYGNPIDAVIYFKTESLHAEALISECTSCGYINPELIFEIIEQKKIDRYGNFTDERKFKPEGWHNKFIAKNKKQIKELNQPLPQNNFKIPSKTGQFTIFFKRNILSKLADKQYLLINLFETPILALILSFLCKYITVLSDGNSRYIFSENENLPAYIFMSIVVSLFVGMSVSAEEIIRDSKIIKRESYLNLSRLSYLNSKIIVLFGISAFQMLLFVFVANTILEIKGMYLTYWMVLFSTACFANMLGLNISASFKSVVTIYIIIPLLLVPQLLLSGVFVKFDKLHPLFSSHKYVPIIGDIMTSRWAYEAITVSQFKNNLYQKDFYEIEQKLSHLSYVMNLQLPELESLVAGITINEGADNQQQMNNYTLLTNEFAKLLPELRELNLQKREIEQINFLLKKNPPKNNLDKKVVTGVLDKLGNEISAAYNTTSIIRDSIIKNAQMNRPDGYLTHLKEQYYNEKLADFVLRRKELSRIHRSKDEFIQIMDPVYKIPVNKFGRAHFYAPVKRIGYILLDTFVFNILVIWLMVLLLYLMLYFNVIKKIVDYPLFFKKNAH